MIVADRKTIPEIRDMIKSHERVLLVGCGTCVTVCLAGGEREVGILDCLGAGPARIAAIVARLYVGLQPGLERAAARSVHAHLLDLVGRGVVESDGAPTIDAEYRRS